jgi:hypothetical protein
MQVIKNTAKYILGGLLIVGLVYRWLPPFDNFWIDVLIWLLVPLALFIPIAAKYWHSRKSSGPGAD